MGRALAVLCDLDGTLALLGGRDPYRPERCATDEPCWPVAMVLLGLSLLPLPPQVILVSGRPERARDPTERWLERYRFPYSRLLLRPNGDYRPDEVVKRELYDREIAPSFDVLFVLDDRSKVVAMWRELGLLCFQVAPGDF